jgi:hypothetical protein
MSYVMVTASSIDGQGHDVQVYLDISGEWTSGDVSQPITWAPAQVTYSSGTLQAWTVQLQNQQPLTEQNQLAAWGTVVWATPKQSGLTYQSGQDVVVRGQFVDNGKLNDTNDSNYRPISDNWPVFAFCADLGQVGGSPVTVPVSIGQVRTPAVSYLGQDLQPLWTSYFTSWQDMLGFFQADLTAAGQRADRLDATLTKAAQAAGGVHYAGLCALALRQAYGGTELVVGPSGQPWAFLKEISSDGNVSTVDVLFPASPVWIYADPSYLSLLLEPLLAYAESGNWPQPFAEHDLGAAYPNATGHNDGGGENMPMEESGNMLIMSAAYIQRAPGSAGKAFAQAHYQILKQWADYLTANLPDPGFQNQTDDFAGPIGPQRQPGPQGDHRGGRHGPDRHRDRQHRRRHPLSGPGPPVHRLLDEPRPGPVGPAPRPDLQRQRRGDGTWGTTYNAYADRLLGTNLVPKSIAAEQAAWYHQVSNLFGLPLQVPHSYAKSDWELFTAAWLSDYPIKQELIDREFLYANTTPSRVPFSDLYDTITGNQAGFQARPVQGGIFSLLALG